MTTLMPGPVSSPATRSEAGRSTAVASDHLQPVSCTCGHSGATRTLVVGQDRGSEGCGERFRVASCPDCGLVFTNPRPADERLADYYSDTYQPYQQSAGRERGETGWRWKLRKAALQRDHGYPLAAGDRPNSVTAGLGRLLHYRRRQRLEWIDWQGSGRLLDFGCGAGGFLRRMQRLGWQVAGVDMSEQVAQRVTRESGIPVYAGTLPHPALPAASFDVVTLWNSLEHVCDPLITLDAVHGLLTDGGQVVIGVPNIDSWTFRRFQADWHALDVPRHLYHFSPASLTRLLEQSGFVVERIEQIGYMGWIRHSARNRASRSWGRDWKTAMRWKPLARCAAAWSEWTGQADFIRVVARRNS